MRFFFHLNFIELKTYSDYKQESLLTQGNNPENTGQTPGYYNAQISAKLTNSHTAGAEAACGVWGQLTPKYFLKYIY